MSIDHEPEELLIELNELLTKLQSSSNTLTATEKSKAVDTLTEVSNFISGTLKKPSLFNLVRFQGIQQKRGIEAESEAQRQLEAHRKEVNLMYQDSERYLNAIQLGAYAALFAVWGFTRESLNPTASTVIALSLTISAAAFGVWEIIKATVTVATVGKHAKISKGSLPDFIQKRVGFTQKAKSIFDSLPSYRKFAWWIMIIPAILAFILLIISFVIELI